MFTRRQFLATAGSSALVSLSPVVPNFLLQASAQAAENRNDRILVVVQLTGGNDGLNTVVPYADEEYHRQRKTLAVARQDVLRINDSAGLHPSLRGFADLFEAGRLAIAQGVGYPNPDRSHFTSMDIWQTAVLQPGNRQTGWLGRYLDAAVKSNGRDVPALHLGPDKQPLALTARDVHALSVQSLARFRLELGANGSLRREIAEAAAAQRAPDDLLSFVQTSATSALAASERVQSSLDDYQTPVTYPAHELGEKLRSVAQLIHSGFSTRIYYVALDGFDTHSTQAAVHGKLLEQLAGGVKAFIDDLAHHDHLDRVTVLMFSEFGRRVAENASRGTDHGAAAPVFLAGGRVQPGLIGAQPSLTDLVDGDLKFHTDFRQVYATLLERWLGWPSERLLGGAFAAAPVLRV